MTDPSTHRQIAPPGPIASRLAPYARAAGRVCSAFGTVGVRLLAVVWAGLLVVGGLWLLLVLAPGWAPVRGFVIVAGFTAVAAGHLVFFVCVADRLFPAAARRLGRRAETVASLSVVAGIAAIPVLILVGRAADAFVAPAAAPVILIQGVSA